MSFSVRIEKYLTQVSFLQLLAVGYPLPDLLSHLVLKSALNMRRQILRRVGYNSLLSNNRECNNLFYLILNFGNLMLDYLPFPRQNVFFAAKDFEDSSTWRGIQFPYKVKRRVIR